LPRIPSLLTSRPLVGRWLGPLLFVALCLMPAPEGMEPEAQRMAAVAAWMAAWWLTGALPIAVTALLPLVLFPMAGILPSARTAVHYGNHLIFVFFGGFALALAMERWQLHRRVALHVIAWLGTSPRRVLLGFMLGAAVLSMWMSNTASTLVMLPIGMAVVGQMAVGVRLGEDGGEEFEQQVRRGFGAVLMVGLAYGASIGGLATLIGTPPNLVFAGAVEQLFPEAPRVEFIQWMKLGVPLTLVMLPLTWYYLAHWAAPLDLGRIRPAGGCRAGVRGEIARLGPWSREERWVAAVFALAALGWAFRAPVVLGGLSLPGWSAWFPEPGHLHDATVAMLAALLLLAVPVRRGGAGAPFALSWQRLEKGLPWGILLLFGGGFALAGGFQASGLSDWIGERLAGLSGVPPLLLVALICLMVTFLTEVTSNTATATMLMPVLAATAHGAGVHPFLLMLPATLAASCAFMLPVATPPNAIVFGSGWVDITYMARVGFWMNLIGVVVITLLVFLLAPSVFGIASWAPPVWAR
jgi:sodium-dependent dicarboxylate transporter 2/3/5